MNKRFPKLMNKTPPKKGVNKQMMKYHQEASQYEEVYSRPKLMEYKD